MCFGLVVINCYLNIRACFLNFLAQRWYLNDIWIWNLVSAMSFRLLREKRTQNLLGHQRFFGKPGVVCIFIMKVKYFSFVFYKDMNICNVIFFVTPEHILVFERDLKIIDADLLIILFYLYRLCLSSYILVTTHRGSIVFAFLRIHIPIQGLIKA